MVKSAAMQSAVERDSALSADEAEALTVAIIAVGNDYVDKVLRAFHGRADKALGYASWGEYVNARLRGLPKLDTGKRRELVAEMRAEGMSTRAIAPVIGASQRTVVDDVKATEQKCSVAEVVSLDGRRRPGKQRKPAVSLDIPSSRDATKRVDNYTSALGALATAMLGWKLADADDEALASLLDCVGTIRSQLDGLEAMARKQLNEGQQRQ
jgi:hypothetical protein